MSASKDPLGSTQSSLLSLSSTETSRFLQLLSGMEVLSEDSLETLLKDFVDRRRRPDGVTK